MSCPLCLCVECRCARDDRVVAWTGAAVVAALLVVAVLLEVLGWT